MELILNTFGATLQRANEQFVITTADGERQCVPVVGITSIHISKGAQISSDAVILAMEHEIGIMFFDKSGNVVGRIWSPKYGSISTIRKGQLAFTYGHEAVDWIKDVLRKKIENQQALLLMMTCQNNVQQVAVQRSINRLENYRSKISAVDGAIVHDIATTLRGWEGVASRIYFETLNLFLEEKYQFEQRSQHPATDVTNALLNYGYGLLYGKIEGALIKVGIDPYIGVLHRDDYNRPVLVYDVIELYRVWIDYVVWNLLEQQVITDECYSIRPDGSCWLEAMGRRMLIQSVNDYMDDVITIKGVNRSRENHMFLYVQDLAQQLKKLNL